jgi:hypothetical protein
MSGGATTIEARSGGPADRLDERAKHAPCEWTGQIQRGQRRELLGNAGSFDERFDFAGGRLPHQLLVFRDHTLSPPRC